MFASDDRLFFAIECSLLAGALLVSVLWWLVGRLGRSRPGLAIGWAIAIAALARLAAAAVVSVTDQLSALRGPDEGSFLDDAASVATLDSPAFFSELLTGFVGQFNVHFLAVQLRLLGSPGEFSLRIVQVTAATVALCLLAAAVYDLAGPRAAQVVAWLAALEPGAVFYSGILNKEALVYLGEGLVVLGAVRMWVRCDIRAVVLMLAGCLVAAGARPYAGAFLAVAAVLVCFHAGMRGESGAGRRSRVFAVGAAVVALGGVAGIFRASYRILESLYS